jgi:hypothetical protein
MVSEASLQGVWRVILREHSREVCLQGGAAGRSIEHGKEVNGRTRGVLRIDAL